MLRNQYSKEDLACLTIRHSLNLEENETETPKAKHSRKGYAVRPEREARGERASDKLARLYADAPQANESEERAKRQAMLSKQRRERLEIQSQLLNLDAPFEDIKEECERIAEHAEHVRENTPDVEQVKSPWWRFW